MTTATALPQIKPMLASPPKAERLEQLRGTHAFDTKLDGIRALLYVEHGVATIINRSGIDVTHRFPEVAGAAEAHLNLNAIWDGEIVAMSGSFQDTARRDKQNKPEDVVRHMATIPVIFVAFDLLHHDGADLRNQPFEWRRQALEMFGPNPDTAHLSTSVLSMDPAFFEQVKALGMEGVIAKRLRSTYRAGRFSDWLKYKGTRSLTCVMIGYELGKGARAHFGAGYLALVGPDGPVEIGRVGSGFTQQEIAEVKAELDAGRPVVCEIEALNKSKDGKLRFPVWKGMRTDLSVADATLAQLNDLPTM